MKKNPFVGAKRSTIVLGATSTIAHTLFGSKTLAEVGMEFGLDGGDVKLMKGQLPSGEEVISLHITLDNGKDTQKAYVIPFSNSLDATEAVQNTDYLLNCEFRVNNKRLKNADGSINRELGADGKPQLDPAQPYMSFGKPSGIVAGELIDIFEEMTEEEKANLATS